MTWDRPRSPHSPSIRHFESRKYKSRDSGRNCRQSQAWLACKMLWTDLMGVRSRPRCERALDHRFEPTAPRPKRFPVRALSRQLEVSTPVRLFLFVLKVLLLSVVAAPVVAQEPPILPTPVGQLAPIEAFDEFDDIDSIAPAPEIATVDPPILPQPESLDSSGQSSTAPFVGDATAPNYWIVSSRCSVQHVRERCIGPWGLDVYHRTPDGQLSRSSLQALQQQLVPGIPVCIFSHGSFVEWESQCREAHSLYVRLRACSNAPLQMIFFTWPSDGPYTYVLPVDVVVRGKQADFNGFHMSYLISHVPESCPVALIGHSHGARVVLSSMQLAAGGSIDGHVYPYSMGTNRRYRVVLAAGALDHDWLNPGQRYDRALLRVECLLNLQNRHDLPLSVYPIHRPFARRAIARSGFTQRDVMKLGPSAAKIREYDVTDVIGHRHLWPYYYQQPSVVGAIVPYVYFY